MDPKAETLDTYDTPNVRDIPKMRWYKWADDYSLPHKPLDEVPTNTLHRILSGVVQCQLDFADDGNVTLENFYEQCRIEITARSLEGRL